VFACTRGHAPVFLKYAAGTTPLHVACQHGDGSRLARLLLRHGARSGCRRRSHSGLVSGIAPIHDAADSGDVRSVRALLDADPPAAEAVTDRGCTALHVAARHGRPDVVGELISRGGGRECVGQSGSDSRGTRRSAAAPGRRKRSCGYRQDAHRGRSRRQRRSRLQRQVGRHGAASGRHSRAPRRRGRPAGGRCVGQRSADSDGTTALHVAARNGFVDLTAVLLERGASSNVGTKAQHQGM
jgi:hypothetical protein